MRLALLTAAVALLLVVGPAVAEAPSGPTVRIVDNAFVRGEQRPKVVVRAGEAITWRWTSRQSHSVNIRVGPERFASGERNGGRYRHRFTRPGTYRIVCALHAPGMKMVVVVRR